MEMGIHGHRNLCTGPRMQHSLMVAGSMLTGLGSESEMTMYLARSHGEGVLEVLDHMPGSNDVQRSPAGLVGANQNCPSGGHCSMMVSSVALAHRQRATYSIVNRSNKSSSSAKSPTGV